MNPCECILCGPKVFSNEQDSLCGLDVQVKLKCEGKICSKHPPGVLPKQISHDPLEQTVSQLHILTEASWLAFARHLFPSSDPQSKSFGQTSPMEHRPLSMQKHPSSDKGPLRSGTGMRTQSGHLSNNSG